jgi:hypothetical protein
MKQALCFSRSQAVPLNCIYLLYYGILNGILERFS